MAARIRKGDTVLVITGVSKNRRGEVIQIFPKTQRAIVSGVNIATHHVKADRLGNQGGIQRREATIHISNLKLVDPTTNEPTKVSFRVLENGTKVRVARKTGEVIQS
jgi:large subunit ribosomal protein L24